MYELAEGREAFHAAQDVAAQGTHIPVRAIRGLRPVVVGQRAQELEHPLVLCGRERPGLGSVDGWNVAHQCGCDGHLWFLPRRLGRLVT